MHLLINSIYKLGFSPYDVKYIIHTHWHSNHTEATAPFVHLTGAKTFIGERDAKAVRKYFTPDVLLKDGDIIRLGNTEIKVMETPGHTMGTISLFFETEENGIKYQVGTFGGAEANTLAKGKFDYDDCRCDYLKSLNKLRKINLLMIASGMNFWIFVRNAYMKPLKKIDFLENSIYRKPLEE